MRVLRRSTTWRAAARATPLSASGDDDNHPDRRPTALYRAREVSAAHCVHCVQGCVHGLFAYYVNEKSLSAHIAHIFLTHCYRKKTAPNNCPIEDVMRSRCVQMCATPSFPWYLNKKCCTHDVCTMCAMCAALCVPGLIHMLPTRCMGISPHEIVLLCG